jgi:cation diffusion facilitator CzcD-associated flavoprotein CzcO
MSAPASPDKHAIRSKYAEERAKRLRPDGLQQYIRLSDHFPDYARDPHMPVSAREPLTDHVTFAFIGGGFSGLLAGARLKESGIDDVRIIDRAGDFGGTWYWNRYPGAMCDTASLVYMPLLEETGHMPSEKYAHGPEILEHCQRIGKQYSLYDKALFHTEVTELTWNEDSSRWTVHTNRGDRFTAQFIGMGTGPLHVAKLPRIPGIESFEGHWFHTSRWDYDYTGGDPSGAPLDRLADKRVAIIGTGATAVQCVPELAKYCKELYVFQRTPSSVDVRGNRPIDPQWFEEVATPGWQQRWLDNFTTNWEGFLGLPPAGVEVDDYVQDGWTELGRRLRSAIISVPPEKFTPEYLADVLEDIDCATMERIRARVDEIVTQPGTAAGLKAWYSQLCKRPCFHDEYLQAFNRPNTRLVDTDGKGVDAITPKGVAVNGTEYEVDCIIYSTGFEFGTDFVPRAGYDLVGGAGTRLSEYWADGIRTLHGMHVHGFPNAFIVQLAQGANLGSNVPHNFVETAKTIAAVVGHAVGSGYRRVEASREAEEAWVDMLLSRGQMFGRIDCTPGYYNNEGQPPGRKEQLLVGYPEGSMAFFRFIDQWRGSGQFTGLTFS